MKQCVHLTIQGKVQGVNYRTTVQGWARDLNLTGYVTNNPDGTVDITAQGDKADLEEFIKLCQAGPTQAQVTDINQHWSRSTEDFFSFEIR